MERLLDGTSKEAQTQYALADISTIKEVFLLRYLDRSPAKAPAADAAATPIADERPPALRRGDSVRGLGGGVSRTASGGVPRGSSVAGSGQLVAVDEEELPRLANELCERLAPAGKPAVSVWQLHRLVDCLYPHDPRAAVAHANLLTDPRPPPEPTSSRKSEAPSPGSAASSPSPRPAPHWRNVPVDGMSTYDFLRRLGLEEHAYSLEDAGFAVAQDLEELSPVILAQHGITDTRDANAILDVLRMSPSRPDLIAGFQCPDRRRAAALFLKAYAGETVAAERFARAVTDDLGHGLASVFQIVAYLHGAETALSAKAAATGAETALIEAPRAAKPRRLF